jgi:hypothetical protein
LPKVRLAKEEGRFKFSPSKNTGEFASSYPPTKSTHFRSPAPTEKEKGSSFRKTPKPKDNNNNNTPRQAKDKNNQQTPASGERKKKRKNRKKKSGNTNDKKDKESTTPGKRDRSRFEEYLPATAVEDGLKVLHKHHLD